MAPNGCLGVVGATGWYWVLLGAVGAMGAMGAWVPWVPWVLLGAWVLEAQIPHARGPQRGRRASTRPASAPALLHMKRALLHMKGALLNMKGALLPGPVITRMNSVARARVRAWVVHGPAHLMSRPARAWAGAAGMHVCSCARGWLVACTI